MIFWQRLESAAIAFLLLSVYWAFEMNWIWLIVFLLIPDISMVGYLKNARVGAIMYNLGHSYLVPVLLWFLSFYLASDFLIILAVAWALHIAADRMFGFGLKLPTGFRETHLGKL